MSLAVQPTPEPGELSPRAVSARGSALSGNGSRKQQQAELQARINQMQGSRLGSRRLPTVPALARVLPGGGLQAGGAYSVRNSTSLAMALLAGPSLSGAWCAVVGVPSFGVEAAAGFGIDLNRLVLIPHPGEQWLTVTAALADVVSVVLTQAPNRLTPSDAARLKARLRQRGTVLLALGQWPQEDSSLEVSTSHWDGLGHGRGHLQARRTKVTCREETTRRPRSADIWLHELQRGPWSALRESGNSTQSSETPAQPRLVGL
jgi:hypothetical protein